MFEKTIAVLLSSVLLTSPSSGAYTAIEAIEPVSEEIIAVSDNIGKPTSTDEELSNAILTYKKVFGDTKDYNSFSHYINEHYGVKMYQLDWRNNTTNETITCSVGVDGIIYSYNYYNYDNINKNALPKMYKDDALEIAYDFVKTIAPDVIGDISKEYAVIKYDSYYGRYDVTFYRVVNGLLVNDENTTVTVDQNKKVTAYSRYNYSNNVINPSEPILLDTDKSLFLLNENLPFELIYRTVYPDGYKYGDKAEVKLFYKPNSLSTSHVIDAGNGNLLEIFSEYNQTPLIAPRTGTMTVAESAVADSEYRLTEVESAAVEMQESFITVDEITNKLLNMEELNFHNGYEIVSSRLTSSESIYTDKTTYQWRIEYRENKTNNSAEVCVNAETGEISSFYIYDSTVSYAGNKPGDNKKAIQPVEDFLNKYYSDKLSEYKLDDIYDNYDGSKYLTTSYNITYTRYVNGIEFSDNISVGVSTDTNRITSFSIVHSDTEFPSPDNVISKEKAAENYWDLYGLTPYYLVYEGAHNSLLYPPKVSYSNTEKKLIAVYAYIHNSYVDAMAGDVVLSSYSGGKVEYTPRKYYTSESFSDISGHKFETEIYMLTQMDIIGTDNDMYKPDSNIIREDYEKIISSLRGDYVIYSDSVSTTSNKDDTLTREEAIKYLITEIGYSEVADLKGIYDVSYFTDADSISNDSVGYIAIAKGMGLLEAFGDKLAPQETLTNAEAAYIAYTYLVYKSALSD